VTEDSPALIPPPAMTCGPSTRLPKATESVTEVWKLLWSPPPKPTALAMRVLLLKKQSVKATDPWFITPPPATVAPLKLFPLNFVEFAYTNPKIEAPPI
jgi:hypothetical protein